MFEKECEICGTWFTAERSNRKYCDACQKDSAKAKARLNKSIIRSKAATGYYDEPVEKKCGRCGKFLKIVPRSMVHRPMYCDECKEAKAAEPKKPRQRWTSYNSAPPRSKCPQCGRMFDNPGYKKVYCNNDCYTKARCNKRKVIGDVTLTCEICGKQFISHRKKPTYEYELPRTCSKECRDELCRRAGRKGYELSQKFING